MKRVIVLGAAGMAGHMVYIYLNENLDKNLFEVLGTTNSNDFGEINTKLDIFNIDLVSKYIEEKKPDYVINCIGMLIRSSKEFPDKTIYANSYFPHFLAKKAKECLFKLIHISTDCVFSGKQGNYTEFSQKDATDIYGLSKSLGEIIDNQNLTIRTSIIGPEIKEKGEGLFDWFMKSHEKELNGFKSNYWSGVTTLELAKFIFWFLNNENLNGLFHLTNNLPISKFDLLNLFNEIYNTNKTILDNKDYVCNKSFKNTNKNVDYSVPSYETMLIEQKEFMMNNSAIYSNYKVVINEQ